jgi:hypothetical protein
MRRRCLSKTFSEYFRYGAKGINICTRWNSYENFLEDMGERPEGKTLDRIDNSGNYEPNNCRWATPKEQSNNRSTTRIIEYNDKKQSLKMWANELNLNYRTLLGRLGRGWSIEDTLTLPIKGV